MKIGEIELSVGDLDTILESLMENEDIDVADSTLTDMFVVLAKTAKPVTLSVKEEEVEEEVSVSVMNIFNELIGGIDDLDDLDCNCEDECDVFEGRCVRCGGVE
jgi:hypothetical protein